MVALYKMAAGLPSVLPFATIDSRSYRKSYQLMHHGLQRLRQEGGGTYLDLPSTLPGTVDKPSSDMEPRGGLQGEGRPRSGIGWQGQGH